MNIPILPRLEKWKHLEDLIYDPTKDNIQLAVQIIKGDKQFFDPDSVSMMIIHASTVRRFSFRMLANFWSRIPPPKCDFNSNYFIQYLYKKGILEANRISEFYEIQLSEEDLEMAKTDYNDELSNDLFHYIMNDEPENIIALTTIDILLNIKINFDGHTYYPLQLSAFFGSVKVFKSIFLNHSLCPYIFQHVYGVSYWDFNPHNEIEDKDLPRYAIRGGNTEIISILVQNNYNFNNKLREAFLYHRNDIAFWLLDNYRCEKPSLQVVIPFYNTLAFCYTLSRTKNINAFNTSNFSPFCAAVNSGFLPYVKALIDAKADPTSDDDVESRPLTVAAKKGYFYIMQFLLTTECIFETTYNSEHNPFLITSHMRRNEMLQLLLNKCSININLHDENHCTALMNAATNGDLEMVSFLISKGANCDLVDYDNESALIKAVKSGNPDVVCILLQAGTDPNQMDCSGNTPLIISALFQEDIKIMKYLLYFGADPNLMNDHGWTPLIAATISNDPEKVKILLDFDVDIEHKDKSGASALWFAVRFQNKEIESLIFNKMAEIAIENGESK